MTTPQCATRSEWINAIWTKLKITLVRYCKCVVFPSYFVYTFIFRHFNVRYSNQSLYIGVRVFSPDEKTLMPYNVLYPDSELCASHIGYYTKTNYILFKHKSTSNQVFKIEITCLNCNSTNRAI